MVHDNCAIDFAFYVLLGTIIHETNLPSHALWQGFSNCGPNLEKFIENSAWMKK